VFRAGWIYDYLLPQAEKVKVAHPLMLRAIAAAKRKNDKIDAGKISDCLGCDFMPECHMASTEIRNRRRVLRYWHPLMRQMVQTKNQVSGLLMETGMGYNNLRLHRMGYFAELMATSAEVSERIRPLLRPCREHIDRSIRLDTTLLRSLEQDPLLGLRARGRVPTNRGGVKTFLGRKKHQDQNRCAGCGVPQITGWATGTTPEALFELFRDWQRTQTQSSATAPSERRSQLASRRKFTAGRST
jgi:hypothetical protein